MTDPALEVLRPPADEAACAVTLPVLGIPVRFESNAAEVVEAAEEAFGRWSVLGRERRWIGARGARVRIDVVAGDEGAEEEGEIHHGIPRRSLLVITSSASRGRADAEAREAVAEVSEALLRDRPRFRAMVLEALTLGLLSRLDREPLHAAALVRGETALLLAGRSGVGKSTLVYAAARAGLRVLAEDTVFLQPRPFRVWGMPDTVHLPAEARRFFPELGAAVPVLRVNGKVKVAVRLAEMQAARRPVAEHAGICLLARGDGLPALEPVSPDEVARALTERIEPGFHVFADTIGARIRAVAERGAWRLALPADPPDAVPYLHEMLDGLEGR